MTKFQIRLDRVEALILEPVGTELFGKAYPPTLVATQVDNHASALIGNALERHLELSTAVAATGTEHITCQTLGVHPRHDFISGDIAQNERQVLETIDEAREHVPLKCADTGRNGGRPTLRHERHARPQEVFYIRATCIKPLRCAPNRCCTHRSGLEHRR